LPKIEALQKSGKKKKHEASIDLNRGAASRAGHFRQARYDARARTL